jgi:hypothetical protein
MYNRQKEKLRTYARARRNIFFQLDFAAAIPAFRALQSTYAIILIFDRTGELQYNLQLVTRPKSSRASIL